MDNERLIYRRQFIISTKPITVKGIFNIHEIKSGYYLYYHTDLEFEYFSNNGNSFILLGNLYDPDNPQYLNLNILEHLSNFEFDRVIEETFKYAGRFILIYYNHTELKLFNDPVGLRKVYYTSTQNGLWCASQPHRLSELLEIKESEDPAVLSFFKSEQFLSHDSSGIIDRTEFDNIFLLKPNHYLDIIKGSITRYWPNKKIMRKSLSKASIEAANLLSNYIKSIAHRHKIMVPVTAGMDSRLLLAATHDIKEKVLYYINKTENLNDNSNDIKIPKKLADRLGIKFSVFDFNEDVDKTFKISIQNNCKYLNIKNIPLIYNIYFKNFSDYINLPGSFSEVARNAFITSKKIKTAKNLAEIYWYNNNAFAIDVYTKWLLEVKELKEDFAINILDLFYWEERLSNWATTYQQGKDIAQEEVWPFNSRLLMEIMLATKRRLRDDLTSVLQRAMIKYLWKETLTEMINPSKRRTLKILLKKTGIFYVLLYLKLVKNF